MANKEKSSADAKDGSGKMYYTEAYISEILIESTGDCAVKLKPTEDFAVKSSSEKSELIALVCEGDGHSGMLKSADVSFAFLGKDLVCSDFLLSLKHRHDKIWFELNAEGKIVSLVIK